MSILLVLASITLPLVFTTDVKPPHYDAIEFANCGQKLNSKPKVMKLFNDNSFSQDNVKKVMSGQKVMPGTMPWVTKVTTRIKTAKGVYRTDCTGVLITKQHVMTAAHCFQMKNMTTDTLLCKSLELDKMNIVVNVGATNLAKGSSPEERGEERTVIGKVDVMYYDAACLHSDIAILQLDKPVSKYPPICLLDRDEKSKMMGKLTTVNKNMYFAGFGATPAPNKEVLYQANLAPVSPCEVEDNDLACSEQYKGTGTCDGDSGGPLAFVHNSRYYLYGILSGGEDCSKLTSSSKEKSIFERLSPKIKEVRRLIKL